MYFLKRIAWTIPLLLVISMLSFGLVHLVPGGPFDKERAPASPQIKRNIEAKYHQDEPIGKQYWRYLKDLLHGDMGPSYKYLDHSVNDIIAQGLPVSMLLGWLAFGFALGVGLPVGFLSAVKRGGWVDYTGSLFALLAVCVPGLVIAPLLVTAFAIKWRLLPVALWQSPAHAILPSIALGLYFSGKIARLFREGMLNTMQLEFITASVKTRSCSATLSDSRCCRSSRIRARCSRIS
jgi:oligopeptide transport system permease protein